ncbi:TIGR03503 family protein [Ferrimonas balearica]|uniref:TIGR03503 family protein n=1 Tax=Ferrimonas balearica TaxID=44012 RepID=UPI001C588B95|nr:TIGR03503 family protein [Ferrimonas balearica]MBW3163837.1 TIGR03503 family protein [Ferrimonas balearica]
MSRLIRAFGLTGWLALFAFSAQAELTPQTTELLDNRFRIDHAIDQITILAQRAPGSAPVVVVKPDGSKWYAHRHPDSVTWNATQSSDLIRINNPTPGPWQLVGEVVDGSELRLMSEVALRHDPLPERVYRGERVKLTAELLGDDDRIVMRDFEAQLDWSMSIRSANRPGDENFGAGPFMIGAYHDGGKGLDEVPHDGIFTSNLDFNYPAGLYRYKMAVSNEVFHRELTGEIEILPQPVRIALVELPSGETNHSELTITLEPDVTPENLHLDLAIETPDQSRYQLSITPTEPVQQMPLPMVSTYGNYRIEGEAAGTRYDGVEFFLSLPELAFYVAPPPPPPLSAEEMAAIALREAQEREASARTRVIWTVGAVNILLLVVGAAILIVWRKRQRLYQELMAMPIEPQELTPDQVDLTQFSPDDGVGTQR